MLSLLLLNLNPTNNTPKLPIQTQESLYLEFPQHVISPFKLVNEVV
jgi:hypothetical protein